MSARLSPRKKTAQDSRTLSEGEPWWVGFAFLGFSLLICFVLAQTALN